MRESQSGKRGQVGTMVTWFHLPSVGLRNASLWEANKEAGNGEKQEFALWS